MENFNYTYSAKEQEEIATIRNKYTAPQEDKMTQLRRMDARVTQKATTVSLAVGITGALFLGLGMSLSMSELAQMLGVSEKIGLAVGIFVGIVGIALVGMAYPVYNTTVKKEQKKIAPEIIRLADELMGK